MNRRDFLKSSVAVGAAALVPGAVPPLDAAPRLRGGSLLDLPPAQAPVDTIVVLMMENRSFDHYLGWLADDPLYLETGKRLYGGGFRVRASNRQAFPDPDGRLVATYPLTFNSPETNDFRGCPFGDPGHGWDAGRAQRDGGFLAPGSDNDLLALGFYDREDLPFYTALTRRFTVCDRYHCSLLGPTYPNREYLLSAQSGGLKSNFFPQEVGYPDGFPWPTILDRLIAAGVSVRNYYSDLPMTALWGPRLADRALPISAYFDDAAAGQLPHVVFLDPKFVGPSQSDEHPLGDVRQGQRFVWQCVKALVESPQWQRAVMILTYDEWGGFFDHVRPPRFRDDRASRVDEDDFGQAGFRVPTRLLSPYARPNFVDHRLYDHTSILRFIEWRFLGAPPHGPGRRGDAWYLTMRDRYAANIGFSLRPGDPDPAFDPGAIDGPRLFSPACDAAPSVAARAANESGGGDVARGLERGWWEQLGVRKPLVD